MDMVKELFYGNLGVDALGVKKTSEYAKYQRRINTMVEDMEKHIPKEQCERLLNCIAELDDCISIAYFEMFWEPEYYSKGFFASLNLLLPICKYYHLFPSAMSARSRRVRIGIVFRCENTYTYHKRSFIVWQE